MISKKEFLNILNSPEIPKDLIEEAYKVRRYYSGKYVYFRGLIEITNICRKSCFYCGVNKENGNIKRYYLDIKSIKSILKVLRKLNYTSLAYQGGEILSKFHYDFLKNLIKETKKIFNFEITLSFGELPFDILKELYNLGARRYLLRFEVIKPERYYLFHYRDKKHDYINRIKTILYLKKIGYQTGTGNLIGLPLDKKENLYYDFLFLVKLKPDMIGIGPYIPQKNTFLFNLLSKGIKLLSDKDRFFLTLKLIALLRVYLKNINIVASTALITLGTKFFPLEKVLNLAFKCGANVLMPVFTPSQVKKFYSLYEEKYSSEHEKFFEYTKRAGFIPITERYGNPISYYERLKS